MSPLTQKPHFVRGGSEPVPSAAEGSPPRKGDIDDSGAVGAETHRAPSRCEEPDA